MDKTKEKDAFREALCENLVGDTHRMILEASGGDVETFNKIKKYVMAIISIGIPDGNPDEYYAAIAILGAQIQKLGNLTDKWNNE